MGTTAIYYDDDEQAYIAVVDDSEYVYPELANAVRFTLAHTAAGQQIECDPTVNALEVNAILARLYQERAEAVTARRPQSRSPITGRWIGGARGEARL
jgi:hypothetical protein